MPRKTLVLGLTLAITVAALVWLATTQHSTRAQTGPTIAVGSGSAAVGDLATVDLDGLGFVEPGLGAWTIDVTYDPSVVTAVGCNAGLSGVCNPTFDTDTVRVTGASAEGFVGDVQLAMITFECLDEGSTALSPSINVLADATLGNPQDISGDTSIENGSITCGPDIRTPTPTPAPPPFAGYHGHYACRQIQVGDLRDTGVDADQPAPRCPTGWQLIQILVKH